MNSYTLQVLFDRLDLLKLREVRDEAEERLCEEAIKNLEGKPDEVLHRDTGSK